MRLPRITYERLLIFIVVLFVGFFVLLATSPEAEQPEGRSDRVCYTKSNAYCNTRRIQQLETSLELIQIQLTRLDSVLTYASRYGTTPSYSAIILDAAWATGLDPELAFRLVDVESSFDSLAVSRAGALGLTQVMPKTGEEYCPGVNLFDPRLNARCGFTYLLVLLEKTDGDLRRALLMYNRGPNRVTRLEANGRDPDNGYADLVCNGPCGDSLY